MKKRFIMGAMAVMTLAAAGALAGDALKSGLPVGGSPTPFNPLSVTGPFEGKKQCLV